MLRRRRRGGAMTTRLSSQLAKGGARSFLDTARRAQRGPAPNVAGAEMRLSSASATTTSHESWHVVEIPIGRVRGNPRGDGGVEKGGQNPTPPRSPEIRLARPRKVLRSPTTCVGGCSQEESPRHSKHSLWTLTPTRTYIPAQTPSRHPIRNLRMTSFVAPPPS